jgi:hypothetical protein
MDQHAALLAKYTYDPATGLFLYASGKRSRGRFSVSMTSGVGSLKKDGYVHIFFDGKQRTAHRLAWLYMTGEWPRNSIDHINGRRDDNRWCNLRDVSQQVNAENLRSARKGKTSCQLLGVYYYKASDRWTAQITNKGRPMYLGCFETPEAAHEAYVNAKRRLHDGCTL